MQAARCSRRICTSRIKMRLEWSRSTENFSISNVILYEDRIQPVQRCVQVEQVSAQHGSWILYDLAICADLSPASMKIKVCQFTSHDKLELITQPYILYLSILFDNDTSYKRVVQFESILLASIHVSIPWYRVVISYQWKIYWSLSQPRFQVVTSHWSGSCQGSKKEARICETQFQRCSC